MDIITLHFRDGVDCRDTVVRYVFTVIMDSQLRFVYFRSNDVFSFIIVQKYAYQCPF